MARRVGRLAVALPEPLRAAGAVRADSGQGRAPAPRVAYPYRSRPLTAGEVTPGESPPPGLFLPVSAWVVHLALGAAGFLPLPLVVPAADDPRTGDPRTGDPGTGDSAPDALAAEAAQAGAVALVLPGTGGSGPGDRGDSSRWLDDRQLDSSRWRILSLAETPAAEDVAPFAVSPVAAARRLVDLGGNAPPGRGGTPGDEVAVAGRGPADAGDRLLVAWSLLTGGVLLLEANPDARVATAAWSRPTLFLGDGAEVARLHREAVEWEERWRGGTLSRAARWLRRLLGGTETGPGPPFGRLHTLVLRGGGTPSPGDEADFWSSRGVRRLDLASLMQ